MTKMGQGHTEFDSASDTNSREIFGLIEKDCGSVEKTRSFERDPAYKITPVLEDYKGPAFKDKHTIMIKRKKEFPKISIDFASSNESNDSNS